MERRHVYLSQVNNRFGDQVFLPYSVGVIQAYCQAQQDINEAFAFKPFIFLREPISIVVQRLDEPAVLGLSCYVWNWEYQKELARATKEKYPGTLVVMGGPQVPSDASDFFARHPYVDIIVHHEGELAFADILRESLKERPAFTAIAGLSVRGPDGELIRTAARLRMTDLNQIPSPYLAGTFDSLVTLPFRWNASHETNRGCPYSCTFCDWGSNVFTKLRFFAEERLTAELDWFGRSQIEILYNCDANFGIVPRDVDLADKLAETKRTYGYPAQFRPSFAKRSNDTVFRIAQILQSVSLQRGITLSMQSMDEDCLTTIKRRNIRVENLRELIGRYRRNDMPTYTELILGLPGETYSSFRTGIDELLQAGQHEGLLIYLCELLTNAEMNTPEYRRLHKLRTARMPILLGYALPNDDDIEEYFDVVVETATMPFEDWRRSFLLAWVVQCFHCLNLTQALALHMCGALGVPYGTFYESLLDFARDHPRTILGRAYKATLSTMDFAAAGHAMGRTVPGYGPTTWYPEEATFLELLEDLDGLYAELALFMEQLNATLSTQIPPDLRQDLITYQRASLVTPGAPRDLRVTITYNVAEYLESLYYGEVLPLTPKYAEVVLRAEHPIAADPVDYAFQSVRYGRKNNHLRRRLRQHVLA